MYALVALLLLGSTEYVFEAERVRSDASGKVLSRDWLRIRKDGAYEFTGQMAILPFITATRVDYPDSRSEFSLDLLPFFKRDAGKAVPAAVKAARNCSFSGESIVLGMEAVEGYQAIKIRQRVLSDRQLTSWRVPELGCESLRTIEEIIQADGTTKLVSQTKVAWIKKSR